MPTTPPRRLALTVAVICSCFVGCDNDDGISKYDAPKDPPAVVPTKAPTPPGAAQHEPIEWTLPAGWTRLPDPGPNPFGTVAKIQVLPDDPAITLNVNVIGSSDLAQNVTRWKGQLGLGEMTAADMGTLVKAIEVEAHAAHRVDLAGTDVKTSTPARMLAVLLPTGDGGGAWSFLVKGPPEKIAALEPGFDAFIASVKFPSHNHGDDSGEAKSADPKAEAVAADMKNYNLTGYTVPTGWVKDETPRQFRLLTLYTGPEGNARAELMVTKFAFNRFGSMLENVNRWRNEVGLPDSENELGENARELKSRDLIGVVFDFAGTARRSQVAMFRKGADMWFVKLIGPADAVAAQRENYDAFLQSIQFGEAK